jgi:threonine/homoserine/homoserine lactone efflux protein
VYIVFVEFRSKLTVELENKSVRKRIGFCLTLILTASNPLTIVAISAFAIQIQSTPTILNIVCMSAALFLGSLLIQLIYAASGVLLRRILVTDSSIKILGTASGIGVITFGALGLLRS